MIHSRSNNSNPTGRFLNGESLDAYLHLGAFPTIRANSAHTPDGVSGVLFRVWAPNAAAVSVVGDFNGWSDSANPMEKDEESGIWQLFIEGLKEYSLYKYCVEALTGEKVFKSDPFAFYSQLRPDNASIIYNVLSGYDWNDGEWISAREAMADFTQKPMSIYELHLASWKRPADKEFFNYREIAERLVPYLKEMNYTHVEILPITEHPLDESLGFQPTGFFSATSRHGEPKDLMYLIDELHKADIGVILDWVPTGFPKDSFGLVKFDGTALFENSDPMLGERHSWGTCLFDYSKPAVVSFLLSSVSFWLNEFHFDGIRMGALTSMLYLDYDKEDGEWQPNKFGGKENLEAIDFIKKLNLKIHESFPGVLMFGDEHTSWPRLTHPVEEGGLGFDYKWNKGWINDLINYISLPSEWRPFNHDNLTYSFFYSFAEKYLQIVSHDDIERCRKAIKKHRGDGKPITFDEFRAFFSYMFAHPGKKLMFMGCEIGQSRKWECKGELDWYLLEDERFKKLNTFFKELNRFYLDNPPFYELDSSWKGFDWIHHDDYTNSVIAFKRIDKQGSEIIAVCNFQPVKHEKYLIGVSRQECYDEVFSSDDLRYGGSGVTNGKGIIPEPMKIHGCNQGISITLPPMGVIYLKCSG